jgi:UDP-N-acetylglucosamine 2-epimerase
LGRLTFSPKRIYRKIFKNQGGVCLIHGDTLTTLISLLYAKRCGLSVAHVEAGLRSFNLFDPFPEEIIRLVTMRFSDLLLAPSTWAFQNLCKMGYHAKAVNIGANTGLEIVTIVQDRLTRQRQDNNPYAVVTIHRVETIYSRSRLIKVVDIIERIAQERKVFFILHEPTRQQLVRFNFLSKISQNDAIEILPILPYVEFLGLVVGSDYVVTDGGSVQEECYYLDKPCLILRSKTERIEGVGENVFLSEFDPRQIDRFWELFPILKRKSINQDIRPSDVIIDHLLTWA